MKFRLLTLIIAPLLIAAQTAEAESTTRASNPEMTAMFEADQAGRMTQPIDWDVLSVEDAERRERTQALIDAGQLLTGQDFFHAAFIFQHGGTAENYLYAHILAMAAMAKGHDRASWIAAATLDRYLKTIGQAQIFGTQFSMRPGEEATQEPFDRAFVSDAVRSLFRVPPLAAQEEQRQTMGNR